MAESVGNPGGRPSLILVATDLSDLDRLVPYALQAAETTGARLVLFHAVSTTEALATDAAGMPYYDPAGALDIASETLAPVCELARKRNIVCEQLVREGHAAQQVLAVAQQLHADRILLGTRSRSKVSKLLIGSVAEQVLRSVTIPVITVGPEAHLPVEGNQPGLRIVLHATTLRETSRPSAVLASQIASTLHAKLVLLHVLPHVADMEGLGMPTGLDSAAMQELRALAAQTTSFTDVEIEPKVLHGHPAVEILAEASELKASLIVLGATQRSAFDNLTRDRTIYKVLAHARCPVISLREVPAQEEREALARFATHS